MILKDEAYAVIWAAACAWARLSRKSISGSNAARVERSKNPFVAEKFIGIDYMGIENMGIENMGQCLTQRYFADLVCFEQFIVETEALKQLSGKEDAQFLNYVWGG